MRMFSHFANLPPEARGGAVAIGNFDGVHLGHRAVIGEAGRIARSTAVPWLVLTLEPHPRQIFKPDTEPFRITPCRAKVHLVEALGVDALVVIPFDRLFASLSAREFVARVLVGGLDARFVVSGHNFAFGRGRQGGPKTLLELGDDFGFDYTCVHEIRDPHGEPYSSTRVRQALARGDLFAVEQVLGRPFEIEGTVVEGDRRGRTIGFPTANIRLAEYIHPARGVYAVRASADGAQHAGVANIGVRPSFAGHEVLLEVHLFDFDGDLYGQSLRVELIHYLRQEKTFDGLESLTAQIRKDASEARALLVDTITASNRTPNLRVQGQGADS